MILLLDANVLLPALVTPHLLSTRITTLLTDAENRLLVSHATLWELLSKVYRGGVFVKGQAATVSLEAIQALGAERVPITEDDILSAAALLDIHRDPFDRMLIVHAQRMQATIVSSDRKLPLYGVPVIPL